MSHTRNSSSCSRNIKYCYQRLSSRSYAFRAYDAQTSASSYTSLFLMVWRNWYFPFNFCFGNKNWSPLCASIWTVIVQARYYCTATKSCSDGKTVTRLALRSRQLGVIAISIFSRGFFGFGSDLNSSIQLTTLSTIILSLRAFLMVLVLYPWVGCTLMPSTEA